MPEGFAMWRASVLTIFPEMFPGPLGTSLAGKALAAAVWAIEPIDIRNYAGDRHRSVDDTPAGGGPGMVMRADVLARALDAAAAPGDPRPRLLLSARGSVSRKPGSRPWRRDRAPFFLCGRFEGVDERLIEARQLEEISLGDYVLSGGEIAALVSSMPACGSFPG